MISTKLKLKRSTIPLIVIAIVLTACFSSVGTYYLVTAQYPTSTPITFSGGPQPGTPSYTVFTDGTNCYAKNSYGAILSGSSSTDASVTFNAVKAILTNGGEIYFKNGVYTFQTGIVGLNALDLIGESMGTWENVTNGVVFKYAGGATDVFIDYINCRSFSMSNFKVYQTTGSAVAGIRMGGTGSYGSPNAGRSKCLNFENVAVQGFGIGLLGGSFSGSVLSGHGPDDSVFTNCYSGNNTIADVAGFSSQTKFYGGTFYASPIGVVHTANTLHSPDSTMEFYGTVWSGCDICVDINGTGNIRGMSFFGTWMEDCDTTLLRLTQANETYVGSFRFYDCMGYVNAGATSQFNLVGKTCSLVWDGGELYPADATCPILTGGTGTGAIQTLRIRPDSGAERYTISNSTSVRGIDAGVITLLDVPTGLDTTTSATWTASPPDMHTPWVAYTIIKATVYFIWNPQSTGGGVRLAFPASTPVTNSTQEPGVSGMREDSGDISSSARTWDRDSHIVTEAHGNSTTAAKLYRAFIIYEY